MVDGGLPVAASGKGASVVVYENVLPGITVGQSSHTRFRTDFVLLEGLEAVRAVLEIGVVASSQRVGGFRIGFGRVTLTREFKPQVCSSFGERIFCKFVYDVTPVIRSTHSNSFKVEVEDYSIESIVVEQVGFLVEYSYPGAATKYCLCSGALTLAPREAYRLSLGSIFASPELRFVGFVPHTEAVVTVNGSRIPGNGFVEHSIVARGSLGSVTVAHESDGSYFPRHALASSILVVESRVPMPSLAIGEAYRSEGRIIVKIRNTGSIGASNVIVVALSKGMVVDRKVVERVEAGSEKLVELKAEESVTVRVIWRHVGRTFFREVKVK